MSEESDHRRGGHQQEGPPPEASGLRALVVGASSGIGHEVARQLVDAGASVAAAARRGDRLATIAGAHAVVADVADPAQCESMVAEAAGALGGLDALVYVAGISRITPLDSTGPDAWLELFATNLFGAAACTRAALPHLRAPGSRARALFATSDSADLAYPGLVAYAASKAALGRFCQGLADECPEIKVSELFVGPTTGTEVSDAFPQEAFAAWGLRWYEGGYIRFGLQEAADAGAIIVEAVLAASPPSRVDVIAPA